MEIIGFKGYEYCTYVCVPKKNRLPAVLDSLVSLADDKQIKYVNAYPPPPPAVVYKQEQIPVVNPVQIIHPVPQVVQPRPVNFVPARTVPVSDAAAAAAAGGAAAAAAAAAGGSAASGAAAGRR